MNEQPGADQAHDLAFEGCAPALFVQAAIEQPGEADLVGAVLHPGGRPLARRAVLGEGAQLLGDALVGEPELVQKGAMADQVGVAPDRRGEVAVGGARQA